MKCFLAQPLRQEAPHCGQVGKGKYEEASLKPYLVYYKYEFDGDY